MARTRKPANIIGPVVRQLRDQQGMTQEAFAAKCQLVGWDISRGTISQIEAQLRCVKDGELLLLSRALGVEVGELFSTHKQPLKKKSSPSSSVR